MTYQEFVSGPAAQQRYWARSHLGWSRMRKADPNPGHHALAALEAGRPAADADHPERRRAARGGRLAGRCARCTGGSPTWSASAAGRRPPGRRCTSGCGALNPGWTERHTAVAVRPDGDVDLEETAGFVVPACESCGGVLKPDVVFFGENVPKPRVRALLRGGGRPRPVRRRAARARLVADGDVGAPVRPARRQARRTRRRREPGQHPRRRPPRGQARARARRSSCPRWPRSLRSGDVAAEGEQHAERGQHDRVAEQHQPAGPPGQVVELRVAR